MSDKETVSEADDKLAKADVAGNRWTPERIKALRVSRGWSQEELGRRLGRSRQTAWEWENGVTLPGDLSARALDALAAGEDVTTVVRERPAVVYGASPVLLGRAQAVQLGKWNEDAFVLYARGGDGATYSHRIARAGGGYSCVGLVVLGASFSCAVEYLGP